MGDISEGSSAAHGAQDPEQTGQQGFFSRILSALSPQPESIEAVEAREVAEARASGSTAMPLPGLVNLRRMRVDDISTPKAESPGGGIGLAADQSVINLPLFSRFSMICVSFSV